ncbi:DNA polymerase III subunit alpha [Enterococcus sp. AZ103]|uniref:DNA polymerase III subunit alpha n=1 Tax=Enterococcus sp. AZ103 TaxID=2774628 RepID=UPI003F263BB9
MKLPQLYTRTSYSLLKSTLTVDSYVKKAKELGYSSIAITDDDVLTGAVEFSLACQKYQIQPIIGLNLSFSSIEERHILLYAKDLLGYQELMRISSERMIAEKILSLKHFNIQSDHLIAVLPTFISEEEVDQLLLSFKEIYQGISSNQENINSKLPLVALHEVNYLEPQEAFAIKVMDHLQNGTHISNEELHVTEGPNFLTSHEIFATAYNDHPEAIGNAQKIADACQLEIPLHQKLLPHYPVPDGESADNYLEELCWEKLSERVETVTEVYHERLTMELSIIHRMGFDDYFLIVWDVMDYVHRNQIVSGAGRGSAAGSLVAYVLNITDVDPIKYDLLFERFLNPERNSMPDIDLDIPDNRRNEILHYVKEKYGRFHVAQIATFGTMAAKMVLRDVNRVFGLSQSEANRWSAAIPNQLKITLGQAYEQSDRLRNLVNQSERNQLLYQTALTLEGLPRHVSTHAAGVVISDQDLVNLVPLQNGAEDILLTQFTMGDVERLGLLKMDFLGLRNLSIIDTTLKNIQQFNHETLTLNQIPLDDPATLELFQRGDTAGVFQFESAGIRNVLKKLGPTSIEDIAAVNALYRPGPMQNIDTFIARKKGKEPITYPEAALQPILENTYGIIVYQEQIMQVAAKMAGFSLGQADILRRAVSKKKKDILDEEREHFVKGSMDQGYSQQSAEKVYDYIERFADYGFNRSHAFAYSFVGYQMAYLKVHYPGPFYTALLQSVRGDSKKMREYIAEASRAGIDLLGPDINKSQFSFTLIDKNLMRFGLDAIKGIRRDFVANILSSRNQGGSFKSLDQFLLRIDERWLKYDYIAPLIYIGVFDNLHNNRKELLAELEGKLQNVVYSGGSLDLLNIMSLKKQELTDYDLAEKLDIEEQYLGFYLSGHPTEGFPKLNKQRNIQSISQLAVGSQAEILFYLKEIREIRTKKGGKMAFLTGNDLSGEISATVFPQYYRRVRENLSINQVYLLKGKVERSNYDQSLQVLVEEITLAESVENILSDQTLYLKVTKDRPVKETEQLIADTLKKSAGNIPVIIYFESDGRKIALSRNFWIGRNERILTELGDILGEENVVLR